MAAENGWGCMEFGNIYLPLPLIASLLAALVTTLGLLTVVLRDNWASRNQVYFTALAAGILVTSSLLLFPEALESTSQAPFIALSAYLVLYGTNVVFQRSSGAMVAPIIAIGVHSLIDGFEYSTLFQHDVYVGWVASIGLITHEFAEGIILYVALRLAGSSMWTSTLWAFFAAALTTPIGAAISEPLLRDAPPEVLGMALAAASGALLYLGATHLPTHLTGGIKSRIMLVYLLGVAFAIVLTFLHGGEGHAGDAGTTGPHEAHENYQSETRAAPSP